MRTLRGKKVFVGMSGGVDSSVAAHLLKKQGYDVTGVFLRSYNVDGCAERDAEDARRVAEKIGILFYVWDVEDEYKAKVVEYMVREYKAGLTPNPDVMCNREIKFGIFLRRALEAGAQHVATGHYVRLARNGSGYALCAAKDENKDQSYFLWTLTQKQLAHSLFPIGEYLKPKVRAIARKAGLLTAEKKDSQGICFLGQVTLTDFLKTYVPEKTGAVVDVNGKHIGEHRGAHFYTSGQRHAGIKLEISGKKGTMLKPHYVVSKNTKSNTLMVAEGAEHPALYRKEIKLTDVNFFSPTFSNSSEWWNGGVKVFARVRYRQPLFKATLSRKGGAWRLMFGEPQKFVAPGQSAVFYSETGEMLGGGVIMR